MQTGRYSAADLMELGRQVLTQPQIGMTDRQAMATAKILVEADLRVHLADGLEINVANQFSFLQSCPDIDNYYSLFNHVFLNQFWFPGSGN